MSIPGLERLEAWSKSMDFALRIYKEVLPLLPPEERWGLSQQMRRSAQSIPANIAEGYGRYYYQDNVRFCYMARGSSEELLSHLVLAHQIGSVPSEHFTQLAKQGNELVRLINGYIAYLKRRKQGANEPGDPSVIREDHANLYLDDRDITPDLRRLKRLSNLCSRLSIWRLHNENPPFLAA